MYDNNIKLINNYVEDYFLFKTKRDNSPKIRFVKRKIIGYHKIYNILLEAFKTLLEDYREKMKLFFCGKCYTNR